MHRKDNVEFTRLAMSFTLDISVGLGSSKAGLDLAAQLIDSFGAEVTSQIETGFTEMGDGWYLWHFTAFPDDFRGGIKFFETSDPATVLAFLTL